MLSESCQDETSLNNPNAPTQANSEQSSPCEVQLKHPKPSNTLFKLVGQSHLDPTKNPPTKISAYELEVLGNKADCKHTITENK